MRRNSPEHREQGNSHLTLSCIMHCQQALKKNTNVWRTHTKPFNFLKIIFFSITLCYEKYYWARNFSKIVSYNLLCIFFISESGSFMETRFIISWTETKNYIVTKRSSASALETYLNFIVILPVSWLGSCISEIRPVNILYLRTTGDRPVKKPGDYYFE